VPGVVLTPYPGHLVVPGAIPFPEVNMHASLLPAPLLRHRETGELWCQVSPRHLDGGEWWAYMVLYVNEGGWLIRIDGECLPFDPDQYEEVDLTPYNGVNHHSERSRELRIARYGAY
jgi:hypothetical protein